MTISKLMIMCANLSTKTTFKIYHNGIVIESGSYFNLPKMWQEYDAIQMFHIDVENDVFEIFI